MLPHLTYPLWETKQLTDFAFLIARRCAIQTCLRYPVANKLEQWSRACFLG